jgi:hypothetical protein
MLLRLPNVASQDQPIPWVWGQRFQFLTVDLVGEMQVTDGVEFHISSSILCGGYRTMKSAIKEL